MTVGERLKELREKLGISQVDFAAKINVSKQTLYKYENNIITNLPSDKIEAAAKLGNISPAYLMGWSESSSDKSPELTVKDERDIKKDLDSLREKLENKEYGPAAYDGQDIPDEDIDLFLGQVELMLRRLKVKNKEKYNPNKNKK